MTPDPDLAAGSPARSAASVEGGIASPPGEGARRGGGRSASQQVKWSALHQVLAQLLQLASGIVLARLLTPADFGTVAIVMTVTNFAMLFTDLGIGAALIHRPRLDARDEMSAFWVNAVTGAVLTGLFLAAAPLLAAVYDDPALTPLVQLASLNFVLSLSVVPEALLQRTLQFRRLALADVTGVSAGVLTSVALAAAGEGPISLVVGTLVTTVCRTSLMWGTARWLPRGRASRSSAREIWGYGRHLLGFNAVNYWARNFDNLLIGKVSGAAPLGYYTRAYTLMLLPVSISNQALNRVLLPAMAAAQDDLPRLRRVYVRAVSGVFTVGVAIALGLAVTASDVVAVVYGSQWGASGTLLLVLALSTPAQIVGATTGPLYQAVGRTDLQFRWGLVSSSLSVIAFVIGVQWGALGVATAYTIKVWVVGPLVLDRAWRLVGLRATTVVRATLPQLACAVGMAAVVLLVSPLVADLVVALRLAVLVVAGGVVYTGLLLLLARPAVADLLRLVPSPRKRHSARPSR